MKAGKNQWIRENKGVIFMVLGTVAAMFVATALMGGNALWPCWALGDSPGSIGDAVGGMTAPILGLLTVVLIFMTFRDQRQFIGEQSKKDHFEVVMKHFETNVALLDNQNLFGVRLSNDISIWNKMNEIQDPGGFFFAVDFIGRHLSARCRLLINMLSYREELDERHWHFIQSTMENYFNNAILPHVTELNRRLDRLVGPNSQMPHNLGFRGYWFGKNCKHKVGLELLAKEAAEFNKKMEKLNVPAFDYLGFKG